MPVSGGFEPTTRRTRAADVFLARVIGDVVSTHRHEHLGHKKLLLVRRLDLDDREEGA